jgi:hypothetical protein
MDVKGERINVQLIVNELKIIIRISELLRLCSIILLVKIYKICTE